MPLIANDDIVQVTFRQTYCAQRVLNVMHARVAGLAAPTDYAEWAQIAANTLEAGFGVGGPFATWLTLISDGVSFNDVRVQRVFPVREVYYSTPATAVGAINNPVDTPNIAASITKRTEYSSRHGVGRLQMAGVDISHILDGTLDPTYLTNLEVAFDWMTDPFPIVAPASNLVWCLYDPLGTPVYTEITGVIPQDTVRTMHRRSVRLGE